MALGVATTDLEDCFGGTNKLVVKNVDKLEDAVKVAKKNKVAVCIVDNPIQWNEDKIKIIFLICAANKADKEFDKLFEMIVSLFDYPTKLKKLEKVKTYDEFIRTLLTKDN